jgi:hypothetical protein
LVEPALKSQHLRPAVPRLQIQEQQMKVTAACCPINANLSGSPSAPSAPSACPAFRPEIVQVAAAALLPAQSLFENAWQVTVNRVQTELNKMYTSLASLLHAEKAAHARTLDTCTHLQHELENALGETAIVRKETERLRKELAQAVGENDSLRTEMRNMFGEVEEAKNEGQRLFVENGILREGWVMHSRLAETLSETGSDGDKNTTPLPPVPMDILKEQIRCELEVHVGKRSSLISSFSFD